MINLPGIPCDEDIRWEKGAPWYVKRLNKTSSGVTKEHKSDDGAWKKYYGYALSDRLSCPFYLATGVSAVQTITVCGVEVPPKYVIHFDFANDKKAWKVAGK